MTETTAAAPRIFYQAAPNDPILAEITRRLVAALNPVRVYLFGSRARDDNEEDSDYDVLVVVPTSTERSANLEQQAHRSLHGIPVSVDVLVWQRERFERQLVVVASLPATVLEPSAEVGSGAERLAREAVTFVLSRLPAAVVTGLCPS